MLLHNQRCILLHNNSRGTTHLGLNLVLVLSSAGEAGAGWEGACSQAVIRVNGCDTVTAYSD